MIRRQVSGWNWNVLLVPYLKDKLWEHGTDKLIVHGWKCMVVERVGAGVPITVDGGWRQWKFDRAKLIASVRARDALGPATETSGTFSTVRHPRQFDSLCPRTPTQLPPPRTQRLLRSCQKPGKCWTIYARICSTYKDSLGFGRGLWGSGNLEVRHWK